MKRIQSKKEVTEFIDFPWKIYKNDSYWIPPLKVDLREKLDKRKNPFFEHAEMDLFLAYKDGEIVGRIAAIIDRNHNEFHNEKVVFFGFYESMNDLETCQLMLNQVAEWGRERGMTILRGPMSLSMNDECAFLLEGFDSPPFFMMPYNPPYYLELMEKSGMKKAKDLYAFFMTQNREITKRIDEIVARFKKESQVVIRTVNMKKLDEEAKKITFVYNNAWEKNWGFVPWTEREMEFMVKKLRLIADPKLVLLAEKDGKPVGFGFGLPNYNEVLKKMNGRITPLTLIRFLIFRGKIKSMRAMVFGVLKEYRNTGLSYYLYSEMEKNAIEQGYESCEMSWQLEDNEPVNRFCTSIGGRIYKKYRIYEKNIV